MNSSDPRELTRDERAAIRKLVTSLCANYDYEFGCLLLDGPCYMFGKWWTGGFCKYFSDAVLPTDPALEATLTGGDISEKNCPVCGKAYIPVTSQAYCSANCRVKGQREADRRRKKKRRGNKG